MPGNRCMGHITVAQTDGCRRFEYMEEKGGLAGHILAVSIMLLARSVPPVEGVGTCSADGTCCADDVGPDR